MLHWAERKVENYMNKKKITRVCLIIIAIAGISLTVNVTAFIIYKQYKKIKSDRSVAEAYIQSGRYYAKEGRHENAVEYFKKAINLNSKSKRAYEMLGASYFKLKEYDEAMKAFRKLTELDPSNANAFYYLGVTY